MDINSKSPLFQDLNLIEYERNLYVVDTSYNDNLLEYYRLQANIVGANYFYCFNTLVENLPIPFIYIYDQRNGTHNYPVDLVEINRKLWTLGEIALAIIIYDDGFKIIDTRNPIKSESEPTYLDGISNTINEIDSVLKHRIFEGLILEESPTDYVSVSPYQKLLNHIENEILRKSKKIGCKPNLLKKLLVKFILIKYLEEQVDSLGNSVFEKDFFDRFILKNDKRNLFIEKTSFCDVLRGNDVVGLLNFLNEKFNGGIFNIAADEKKELESANLDIIANALDGNKDANGQMSIWRYYDFNLLPIEFISRLYERFVTSVDDKQKTTGAYYTPPHLARLLIDELLPFDKEIDFKTFKLLDPSCGSGIFLVLAFKRLITLWMLKNKKKSIEGEEDIRNIKEILSNCIYGVDINEDALSITATSLQIELSSHIRPKEIWEKLTFNNLEEQGNLINLGFFKWYKLASSKFDVIAGNPPFDISESAKKENIILGLDDDFTNEKYIDYNNKPRLFPNQNPALIFLHRSLEKLLKPNDGMLFMVMPAARFLYTTKSFEYKKTIALNWNLDRIYDFTPLREHLWGKTKIATIAVKISNKPKESSSFVEHIVVRNSSANEKGSIRFQIDKYDKFYIPISFLYSKRSIWKTNLLGGGRLGLFVEKFAHYPTLSQFFKQKRLTANIGFTRDKYVINDIEKRKVGKQVVNLKGLDVLDAENFVSDNINDHVTYVVSKDDWVRVPKNGFTPPNILVRLNINVGLPTVFNSKSLAIPNGVLTIKGADSALMVDFVSIFKQNRSLYIFLIKALSPKAFIQQGGAYSINHQDLLNLPINIDDEGNIIPFPSLDISEKFLMQETELIASSLNKANGELFKGIDDTTLQSYCSTFCSTLNLTYELNSFKFITTKRIITKDYVWVTFEHTSRNGPPKQKLDKLSKIEFEKILFDNTLNNSLTINRIITYYGNNNQISFIKSNKLKYWTRSIAYRDVENVRSEMFKNGY